MPQKPVVSISRCIGKKERVEGREEEEMEEDSTVHESDEIG